MGRRTEEVTTYSCDNCRETHPIVYSWIGFRQDVYDRYYAFDAQTIFCSLKCGKEWLEKKAKFVNLTTGDMAKRFPYLSYREALGNTD